MGYIVWDPSNMEAWKEFAELERGLEDIGRARGIYETAVQQDILDMPELLWKEYIEFEIEEEEWDRARQLYERLLKRAAHWKVWQAYATFELTAGGLDADAEEEDQEVDPEAKERARKIFERGYNFTKEQNDIEGRVKLTHAWREFEKDFGSPQDLAKVQKLMPSRVKKRRKLDDDSYEEYMDWLFPADNDSAAKLSNMLLAARNWAKAKEQQQIVEAQESS